MQSRKLLSTFAVILAISLFLSTNLNAATKDIEGTGCKNSGMQRLQERDLFTCIKVSNKLVWKLTDDKTSTFAPYPINGPTWQQLADIREAAAKVSAEQAAALAKAKLDAEIAAAKAAAELKSKQEAEAKAAKAAAEIPKVAGVVIGNLLWSDDFKGSKDSSINSKNWSARNCHRTPSDMGGGACFDSEVVYYAPSAI